MKTKTIILILGLFVVVGISVVIALDSVQGQRGDIIIVGQNYTQQEVDRFNFTGMNLEIESRGNEFQVVKIRDDDPDGRGYDLRVEYPFDFISLDTKLDENNKTYYLGVRRQEVNYYLEYGEVEHCQEKRSNNECVAQTKNRLIKLEEATLAGERGYLMSLQTHVPPQRNWRERLP